MGLKGDSVSWVRPGATGVTLSSQSPGKAGGLKGLALLSACCWNSSDTIDIVRDAVAPGEYKAEEDPRLYRSVKTGRGPLADDWARTAAQTGPLMCAYKLCKVEFRYWGMQAKIEQFIHDVGEHLAEAGSCFPRMYQAPCLQPGMLPSPGDKEAQSHHFHLG